MVAAARAALMPGTCRPGGRDARARQPVAAGRRDARRRGQRRPAAAGRAGAPPLAAPRAASPARCGRPPRAAGAAAMPPRGAVRCWCSARWPSSRPSWPARLPARAATRHATPTAAMTASNADFDLQYEAPWAPGGSADAVPGLTLTRPITLRAGDGSIVAGRIAKPGPGTPARGRDGDRDRHGLARHHARLPPPGGGGEGRRSGDGLRRPHRSRPGGDRLRRRRDLALRRAWRRRCICAPPAALDVQPSPAYAADLGKLLRDQSSRERADRRALARAATRRGAGRRRGPRRPRSGRAGCAGAPAGARTWPRAANDAVAGAIAGIARGYKRLGAARAHAGRGPRIAPPAPTLRRAHADLAHAISALKLLGYKVQRGA